MVSLCPARPTDALDLRRNCFPQRPLCEIAEYLRWCTERQAKGHIVCLVAKVDNQAVANGQLTILRSEGEIGSLVVAAPYRRKGIGTALLQALIAKAREANVHTIEITARADTPWIEAWYRRIGFVFQGVHTFPGDEQVAVLRMTLTSRDKEADHV
jgi:GNAT superfamily N-acetyltransferase